MYIIEIEAHLTFSLDAATILKFYFYFFIVFVLTQCKGANRTIVVKRPL